MRRIQAILLLTLVPGVVVARGAAQSNSYSAQLVCTPAKSEAIRMGLLSFNFSTTQFMDPNTGGLTGNVSSSLKFETPFMVTYKALQAAAASNETFPTCTLALSRNSAESRWIISNAVLTSIAVESEEGPNGSTNVVGTLTFSSVEFE